MINDSSRSSKVIHFGTDRKHICDFLLILNSNLCPVRPLHAPRQRYYSFCTPKGTFLADRTNGRAIATLLRLSSVVVVCDVMYCG